MARDGLKDWLGKWRKIVGYAKGDDDDGDGEYLGLGAWTAPYAIAGF